MKNFNSLATLTLVAFAALSCPANRAVAQVGPVDDLEAHIAWAMWQEKVHELKKNVVPELKTELAQSRQASNNAFRAYAFTYYWQYPNLQQRLGQVVSLYGSAVNVFQAAESQVMQIESSLTWIETTSDLEAAEKEFEQVIKPRLRAIDSLLTQADYLISYAYSLSMRMDQDEQVRRTVFTAKGEMRAKVAFNKIELLVHQIIRMIIAIIRPWAL